MDGNQAIKKTVAIIGASGFIGRHLINFLSEEDGIELRIFVHRNRAKDHPNITFIEGDLLDLNSLDDLLLENCTVINLAYLARNDFKALDNLICACARNKIKRLIHCSTAVVTGRVRKDLVNESTRCNPFSEYEKTKFNMEEILLNASVGDFETVVLRPSGVFGEEGKNLIKLSDELMMGSMWLNYIKSCIYNHRSMNLVSVENVVAALIFLLNIEKVDRESFIISDDDSPFNNYRDIENRLLERFGKSYPFPRIYIPKIILSMLLRITGKSNINPLTKYSDKKLAALGFKNPMNLEEAVDSFAEWYEKSIFIRRKTNVI